MKHLYIIIVGLFFFSTSYAQDAVPAEAAKEVQEVARKGADAAKDAAPATASKKENTWKTLAKITYVKEYDEIMGFKIDKPVFSDKVKELAEKEVTVKGYIIPVEGYKSHTEFIFSAYPYNMCFFCGGAGPETVMEVLSLEPVKYTAEQVVLKGKLVLNSDDINRLMYLLEDAVIVK